MKLQQWITKGQYFQFEGHNIFFIHENHNASENIIFIHGFPTCSWDWSKIWQRMDTKYNLLTLDMMGYGMSDKPYDYDYTIVHQADLILAFLQQQNIQKVHIFAHDYGDSVAQEILYRTLNPSKHNLNWLTVESICFLNGGMLPDVYYPRFIQKALMSPFGPLLTPFLSKRTLHKNFKAIFGKKTQPSQEEIDGFWEMMERKGGKKVVHKIIQYMKERTVSWDKWVAAMQTTSIPLRLINGIEDPISGKHVADKYLEIIPNPDVVLLPEIGHYPNVEAPELVLKHYLEFIDSP